MSVATMDRELTDEQAEALSANYWHSEELTDEQVEELVGDDTSWDAEPVSGLLADAPAVEPQPGDEGRTDTQQEYERSLSAAKTAYYEEKRSIHRLAYALLDLQQAYMERQLLFANNTFLSNAVDVPVHVWGPNITAHLTNNIRVMQPGQTRVKPFARISNTNPTDVIVEAGTVEKPH